MDAHQVLVAARNLIERYGWTQGSHGRRDRGFCAEGALSCGGHGVPDGHFYGEEVDAFQKLYNVLGGPIHLWNDAPERTKEEVLAAFDRAIAQTAPKPDLSFLSIQSDHREVVGSG